MTKIGPNTQFDDNLLADDVILSCGEDPSELLHCLREVTNLPAPDTHSYRLFGGARFPAFSLLWSGIGTGCLEPLLWEVLSAGRVRRLVLIGTAGRLRESDLDIGIAYVVARAYLAGTALDEERIQQPLRPRFALPQEIRTATTVSTDYYYGFSDGCPWEGYPAITRRITEGLRSIPERVDLVDMEVGQFYYLCRAFDRTGRLSYVAVKGPANPVTDVQAQVANSADVLADSLRVAFRMLAIPHGIQP